MTVKSLQGADLMTHAFNQASPQKRPIIKNSKLEFLQPEIDNVCFSIANILLKYAETTRGKEYESERFWLEC